MTSRVACLCYFMLLVSSPAYEVSAQSLGLYHLPSTMPQFCGLGCGAGHHAPMICPSQCHPSRMQRYVRVPGCGACGALPMESFPGCNSPGCHMQLDQLLEEDDSELSPLPHEPAPALEQAPVLEQAPAPEQPPAATEESILPLPKSELLFAPPQL